ncbi:MAG TPA: hypothetical protein VN903_27855 [Polyangia bacterium]|jgi:hypothetical protein|nr:hypothetical protein [Polyangia bacterium]
MGFDFYRCDNLADPRSHDDDRYFRSDVHAYPVLFRTMSSIGVLDEAMHEPRGDERVRSPDAALVPAFKLSSNSGYVVVPEECRLIAAALAQVVRDTREKLALTPEENEALNHVERFARFNQIAADHGGYEVR